MSASSRYTTHCVYYKSLTINLLLAFGAVRPLIKNRLAAFTSKWQILSTATGLRQFGYWKLCVQYWFLVIARWNDQVIPTTKRHCEEERRSNPHLNYQLVLIRGLLHPPCTFSFIPNVILADSQWRLIKALLHSETPKQSHHKDAKSPKNKFTDDPPPLLSDSAS